MSFWPLLAAVGGVIFLAGLIAVTTALTKEAGVDWAQGWRVRCPKCNDWKPGHQLGMIRLGAAGKKYTLGYCHTCDRMRWVVIERYAPGGG